MDDKTIADLISCPKVITEPPRKNMLLQNRHFRNEMKLRSQDGNEVFTLFLRQNEVLPEDFSIGLIFHGPKGTVPLLRCNGPHGEFTDNYLAGTTHFGYHIHRTSETGVKPELTDRYGTFQDAVAYMVKTCSVQGAEEHFKFLDPSIPNQLELWGPENDNSSP